MTFQTVILAAGQGTRMRSARPKVLHPIGGKPLLGHVYELAQGLGAEAVFIVYGHGGERIPESCPGFEATWILQSPQLGTGHAVQQAMPHFADDRLVLILYGDVPLLRRETVQELIAGAGNATLALLTMQVDDPTGYGRIVRDAHGRVLRIVEERDATPDERRIREVNTGILACRGRALREWLARLDNGNAKGEYYLTDIIGMAAAEGHEIAVSQAREPNEVLGINTQSQLAVAERVFQGRQAQSVMDQGVTLLDPARFDVRGTVAVEGQEIEIDVNVVLEGCVRLGHRVKIGANVYLKDCVLGDDVQILPNCYLENAEIGNGSRIGPFARIRPETRLADHVHIGNFVEVKNSTVASGSKINHLSYVGDTVVGQRVNIGAGTITCNYDGANKFQTIIEDGAFIGSDTQLVAPVRVGRNATIGAGSTITKDTPEDTLTLSRSKQLSIDGWQRPVKKEKK
ncbi:bifunctional UDP-N-acetylglucosamine diphosphorylase/glucosamine-1-phosphate N-acetyltransferase GlmU [Methylolobus aquaticus]